MIYLVPDPTPNTFSDGPYGSNSQYASIAKGYQTVGSWSMCKDYLTDHLFYVRHGRRPDGRDYPRHEMFDRARVAYREGHIDYDAVLDLVNQVGDLFGFEPSTYEECTYNATYWEGDARWLTAPPLFGLWTQLMRDAPGHTINGYWAHSLAQSNRDANRLPEIMNMIRFVAKAGVDEVFGTDLDLNWRMPPDFRSLHDNVGPYAFATGRSKDLFPHWKHL